MPRRAALDAINARIAALLDDLAAAQTSGFRRQAYARAAESVAALPAPVTRYVNPDGTLRRIPHVGPSSARVILEGLQLAAPPRRETPRVARAERSPGQPDETFLDADAVAAALRKRQKRVVSLDEYRGDLQMHSTYSDGHQTLQEIAATGIGRGYDYAAVTDHSYGLPVANGVTMARLARQHEEIDRLNELCRDRFRIIKGIEANILADGTVDMTAEERRRLEIVVAAPHSALRSSADQTARLLKAVRTPGIHILGHPRGRKRHVRPGLAADWDRIFAAAAHATVAVEIDGDPRRQDIDHVLASRALDAGCIFALDSDAHATAEWAFAETAVAHARLAGIPSERIVNCWPLEFLLQWAAGLRA